MTSPATSRPTSPTAARHTCFLAEETRASDATGSGLSTRTSKASPLALSAEFVPPEVLARIAVSGRDLLPGAIGHNTLSFVAAAAAILPQAEPAAESEAPLVTENVMPMTAEEIARAAVIDEARTAATAHL